MCTAGGIIKKIESFLLKHNVGTDEGESGGSVWLAEENGTYCSIGIHTQGYNPGEGEDLNTAVQISRFPFNNIKWWVENTKDEEAKDGKSN
ncbi:hypothetical protein [Candidatus Paracaedibacter symbiosus]|uniref:hypothetical protein n=1 Tax=Candidatus Paracaedibacter symbiosus TaxID=244582 RepID=UPI000509443F|nr:hypothetical protein [Candidatus Paracaedibacter symbiosus]